MLPSRAEYFKALVVLMMSDFVIGSLPFSGVLNSSIILIWFSTHWFETAALGGAGDLLLFSSSINFNSFYYYSFTFCILKLFNYDVSLNCPDLEGSRNLGGFCPVTGCYCFLMAVQLSAMFIIYDILPDVASACYLFIIN
jgi:hypothetical protein